MRRARVKLPKIHRTTLTLFSGYVDWYLRRNFHALRVAGRSYIQLANSRPLLVCLNHPSWWDPLVALELAMWLWPDRSHFAPMDASALKRYGFFRKIGFFGIEPGTVHGGAEFLRVGSAILRQPNSVLWVTAQGEFADPRIRPVTLRTGTGHLLWRTRGVTVLPVALEYPFWEERSPEALVRFGEPLQVDNGSDCTPQEWTSLLAAHLEATSDQLAQHSMARERDAFQVITAGCAGIGVYDLWRTVAAAVRGQRFHSAHGSERL